ncbi:DinB family protein [Pedobacter sp. P351]|uniref:DinB family protein n=1 Tax=Pedobacter superstes TaxID=3133441 RepID=UPI0030A696FB
MAFSRPPLLSGIGRKVFQQQIIRMFKEFIKYTEVSDARIISTFSSSKKNLPEAEFLFSHVLNAQHIWTCRIKGTLPFYQRFQIHTKQSFQSLHTENIENLYALLDTDLERIVKYSNTEGGYFESKISDILFHLVNHSTYHRAQIAMNFRLNGIQPPVTDFITLKRENLL